MIISLKKYPSNIKVEIKKLNRYKLNPHKKMIVKKNKKNKINPISHKIIKLINIKQ